MGGRLGADDVDPYADADEAALREAHAALLTRVKQQGFDVASVPVILQPMRRSKVELIVGASHEPPSAWTAGSFRYSSALPSETPPSGMYFTPRCA